MQCMKPPELIFDFWASWVWGTFLCACPNWLQMSLSCPGGGPGLTLSRQEREVLRLFFRIRQSLMTFGRACVESSGRQNLLMASQAYALCKARFHVAGADSMFWAMFRRPRSSSSDAGVTCGHTGEAEPGSYRILGNWFRCLHVGVDRYDVNGNTFRGCLRTYVLKTILPPAAAAVRQHANSLSPQKP